MLGVSLTVFITTAVLEIKNALWMMKIKLLLHQHRETLHLI